MGTVLVNGVEVEVADDERLNGIQAAARAGVDIPRYCWHPGLSVVASCRMCLVETGTRNAETGAISMMPKLVPACQTPAKAGTVFVTESDAVKKARAMVEEDLLIDHPIDCPICDKAGECYLQDYHFEHGQKERRADIRPFTSRRRDLGPTVTLFVDRCVMCSRCVRFGREVAGTSELLVINRGSDEEIDVLPGFPLENKLSGNVVDLCPVGALGDKDFLYQQRVWFMKRHRQVCTHCATGCSIWTEENQDHVYRVRPRENPHVNQWWMCDIGRYGFHYVHDAARLVGAERRDGNSYKPIEWTEATAELGPKFDEQAKRGRLAAVLSPFLTVEEAFLLARWIRARDVDAMLAVGPVPVEGDDERFKSGFTIRAERCPNRKGIEAIVRHPRGELATWEDVLVEADAGRLAGVWITGGYPKPWVDEAAAGKLADVPLVVVQDLFGSPLWEIATYRLPGTAFAEREGSYVNANHRLQSVDWAVRPPAGARVEGSVYWQLLGMPGLYKSRRVLDDLAATIAYFAPAAEIVPETGVQLDAAAAQVSAAPLLASGS
ncbi:MAG: molybdopterin-dependent oxidoreductase [Pirellulales bacterium]|nr:molybdopterin-dependent oxidoreductase [Pirellulales bacterium]